MEGFRNKQDPRFPLCVFSLNWQQPNPYKQMKDSFFFEGAVLLVRQMGFIWVLRSSKMTKFNLKKRGYLQGFVVQ